MKTVFLTITDDEKHNAAVIEEAAAVIRSGGLVAIPTETVYGLAGSAYLADSAEKIYAAKGRPADNPLIVHIAEPTDAEAVAYPTPLYDQLAARFMPGPLTIILPKKDVIPDAVTAGMDSVAIRCPSHPVAHALIRVSGHPIAAPSANRSGVPSPTEAGHVRADMDGRIDMILDGGPCDIGLESTVIKLDGDGCTILRPGAVTADMLAEVCAHVTISPAVIEPTLVNEEKPESPGMKYKHYAPDATVVLIDADEDVFYAYIRTHAEGKVGVLLPDEDADRIDAYPLFLGKKGDAAEASHRFFTLLREADRLALDTVYAKLPPAEGAYLALYNRIIRAAGCKVLKLGTQTKFLNNGETTMTLVTEKMQAFVEDIQQKLIARGRPTLAKMFAPTYLNTIETTVKLDENGAFVITGDIPAMWLRDSSAQVRHYLPLTKDDAEIRSLVASLVKRQALCILNDPYANAFNRTGDKLTQWGESDTTENNNPMAWERKYEIDSLCYPVNLAYHFWKASETADHLDDTFKAACVAILDLFETEQHHAEKSKYFFIRENCPPTDTLCNEGKGSPVAYTGMTWSGFRPSDDCCTYHYLIPSEMFASVILGYMAEMANAVYHDDALTSRATKLKGEIDAGIAQYAIVDHPNGGKMYAYETDGLGNYNLMDDANVPSLLSLPYLGYCSENDELYKNTRDFILSKNNPYYFEGKCAKGIGSPHTPKNYVWHVSLAMQGLTSTDENEIEYLLDLFETTTAGTGLMHEGFHVDNPDKFTRDWFAWANSIFAEFIIHAVTK